MLNARKSQTALEFLMTYGWAILVVLIVISALAYFGVLNPQRLLPSRCSLPTGFSCQDFVASKSGNSVKLSVTNGMGVPITVSIINLTSQGTNPSCPNVGPLSLTNGQATTVTFACPGMNALAGGDQKYRWDIIVQYYAADSTVAFAKIVKGELLTTLEP